MAKQRIDIKLNLLYNNVELIDSFKEVIKQHFHYLSPSLMQYLLEKQNLFKSSKMSPSETWRFMDEMVAEAIKKFNKNGELKKDRQPFFPTEPIFGRNEKNKKAKIKLYQFVPKPETIFVSLNTKTKEFGEYNNVKELEQGLQVKYDATIIAAINRCFVNSKTYLIRRVKI